MFRKRRIGTLNCGHVAFPIILGVNEPQYTPDQLRAMAEENAAGFTYQGRHYTGYEATQKQRQLERSMRVQKNRILVSEATGDANRKQTAQIRLNMLQREYKNFSKSTGLRTQAERAHVSGFTYKHANDVRKVAQNNHFQKLKEIGATDTPLKNLEKYQEAKYNNTAEYALLSGYTRAVQKGDISPLVGLSRYRAVDQEIRDGLVGITANNGTVIESFATHFIDRVIGQTSSSHPGMRCGVSIEDIKSALVKPLKIGEQRELDNGDIRQTFYGEWATVTISIRDKRLIQTNPRKGGSSSA